MFLFVFDMGLFCVYLVSLYVCEGKIGLVVEYVCEKLDLPV